MITIIPPKSLDKINKQIRALKAIIPLDTDKDREIHMRALKDLEKIKEGM